MTIIHRCIAAAMLSATLAAHAQVSFVDSAAALNADDRIDWAQFGSNPVPDGATFTSDGGLQGHLGSLYGGESFTVLEQGVSWAGSFAAGDHVLRAEPQLMSLPDGSVGINAITMTFDTPVYGVGFGIESDLYGSFVAAITTSDGQTFSQASYSGCGPSSLGQDCTLYPRVQNFMGLVSHTATISSISFALTRNYETAFGIGPVHLNVTSPAPEPSTWALMVLGLAGIAGFAHRKRRNTAEAAA